MKAMEEFRKKMPETYKKTWIIGGFGTAVGAGIGGYVSALKGNYIYAGIGAAIGNIVGVTIGLLIRKKIDLQSLVSTERTVNIVGGVISLAMAIAGIIAFISTPKWIYAMGVLFFGACGVYLLKKND